MAHGNSYFLAYCNFYTFSPKFMTAMNFLNKILDSQYDFFIQILFKASCEALGKS